MPNLANPVIPANSDIGVRNAQPVAASVPVDPNNPPMPATPAPVQPDPVPAPMQYEEAAQIVEPAPVVTPPAPQVSPMINPEGSTMPSDLMNDLVLNPPLTEPTVVAPPAPPPVAPAPVMPEVVIQEPAKTVEEVVTAEVQNNIDATQEVPVSKPSLASSIMSGEIVIKGKNFAIILGVMATLIVVELLIILFTK